MRFLPQTDRDVHAMLAAIGVPDLDALIAHVPANLREHAQINLAPGRGEAEVAAELSELAARDAAASGYASFLGAGYYRHYVPAAVRAIIARAEFATSYTPYQAEASQGTTQAIFEFQTLITQLTAMEVANASMYDGASATAEAVLMARRIHPRRHVVALSRALWPEYRATIRTYLSALDEIKVVEIPFDAQTGTTDQTALAALVDDSMLCAVLGYPNAFGVIEPLGAAAEITHRRGGLLISATAEGLALGLLKPPGELGADIVVGEGQSYGLPLQFGGPGLGFLAAHDAHVRQMPGRLVGQTRDRNGRRAFCLTLATREQHIRRERATSNICTNHSLCALAATVYLAQMGRTGMRELAERNVELAHTTADTLAARGIRCRFSGPFFNEFAVAIQNPQATLEVCERAHVIAGVPLAPDYPEVANGLLIAVTEMNRSDEIDALARVLEQAEAEAG